MMIIISSDFESFIKMIIAMMGFLLAWRAGKTHITVTDEIVIEAHETVMAALSDGDFCERVKMATGRDLRDQITVEEMEDINLHVKMLKMGNGRN